MTGAWIAIVAAVVLAASFVRSRIRGARPRAGQAAKATIVDLGDTTSLDHDTGAVRSVQRADLVIDEAALREIWTPVHLERLARTYWRFLTRVTLGLIRVSYSDAERSVVLIASPLRLLTFQAPEYEMDSTRGLVRWRIARGLLVSRRGRGGAGYLQIEVRRSAGEDPAHARLHVEVEVANFYPSIASGLSRRLYNITQSRIHVIVTYGFLRSLARLDLAESRVGRFNQIALAADSAKLGAVVRCADASDRSGTGAGDQRFCRGTAGARVAHTLQHVAVRDAGGGEEDVLTGDEVIAIEHMLEVIAGLERGCALALIARPQPFRAAVRLHTSRQRRR